MVKLLILMLLTSCASVKKVKRNDEILAEASESESFFLSNIPSWINFHATKQCHRADLIRFMDFPEAQKKLGLTYEQVVQLQFTYNLKLINTFKEREVSKLSFEEKSFIFYNSYELILGGKNEFLVPDYPRVHVIDIDGLISGQYYSSTGVKAISLSYKKQIRKFASFLDSYIMGEGHPVIASECYSRSEIFDFLKKFELDNYDFRVLSYEATTPFGAEQQSLNRFYLPWLELLKEKKIYLFTNDSQGDWKEVKSE